MPDLKDRIFQLACAFRDAISRSKEKGMFKHDWAFDDFPLGSCGDASYLLAEFFHQHGVETIWASYRRDDWTHAWLIIKDDRVVAPVPQKIVFPRNIQRILTQYGNQLYENDGMLTRYEEKNIKNAIIVDITGDQFNDYEVPVYVGLLDAFHRTFDFVQAVDYDGLKDGRLSDLYQMIVAEIPTYIV